MQQSVTPEEADYMENSNSMQSSENTMDSNQEVEIPPVLEQLLAFKDQREEDEYNEFQQSVQVEDSNSQSQESAPLEPEEEDDEENTIQEQGVIVQKEAEKEPKKDRDGKLTKNQKKKNRKKNKKKQNSQNKEQQEKDTDKENEDETNKEKDDKEKDENKKETGETDVEVE